MNAVAQNVRGELLDDSREFFAPMSSDLIDALIGEYGHVRKRIEALAAAVRDERHAGALHYFIEGNASDQPHSMPRTVDKLFNVDGAVAHLNASFWDRALRMTDVIDYMPQKRRGEWFDQIKNPLGKKQWAYDSDAGKKVEKWEIEPLPEFEEETVRSTLMGLLGMRSQFLAERVDGIFRALSRTHVTNRPQGFSKRMILPGVITSYGTVDSSVSGCINDLRCVIAKFMGRDEPRYTASDAMLRAVRRHNGQWAGVDGNAFRIRIYNGVGTAHIEVHPDIAWRLNSILAHLYLAAIPAEFRRKPSKARKVKDFNLFARPLPFSVISMIATMKMAPRRVENPGWNQPKFRDIPCTRMFDYGDHCKHARAEAEAVLAAIGGVRDYACGRDFWRFDYEPTDVLDEIVCSGQIPDHRSHQFYPTPVDLAEELAGLVMEGAQADASYLDPEAGYGALADQLPRDQVDCVEISQLHCTVLKTKGYRVVQGDFLKWRGDTLYDRVIMNPPFSEGRWRAHLEHAASMVKAGGRLGAILPASARGKVELPGFALTWSKDYDNKFPGTSVSVVMLIADKLP